MSDSGIASNDGTPDGSGLGTSITKKDIASVLSSVEQSSSRVKSLNKSKGDDEQDDDFEDLDETLAERLWGLTEMFPERLRNATDSAVMTSARLAKGGYSLMRQLMWIAASSSVLLFAPVLFELERLNVEEMMKMDRNRLVLGPGSGGSPPISGVAGPPR